MFAEVDALHAIRYSDVHFASVPEQMSISEADPTGAQPGLLRYGHVKVEGLEEDTAAGVLETEVLVDVGIGVDSGEIEELDDPKAAAPNGAAIMAARKTKYRIMNELGPFKLSPGKRYRN